MAVSFTSATNRRMWQSSLLASALWIIIAVVAGHLVAGNDSPWTLAALIYAAFVIISTAWWLTRALVNWLVWRVLWRTSTANNLVATFEKQGFPKPPPTLLSPEDWFAQIVALEDAPIEQRLAAGGHYLRIVELASDQGFVAMMRSKAVYEDAIAGYRATFRQ